MSLVTEKLPITVVILTKNEEMVVARAIESALNDYAEVIVLDSFSDDNTVNIARQAGAAVIQEPFKGYASQRNFALKDMPKSNEWIFFLDADEMISEPLTAELRRDFAQIKSGNFGMGYVRRKDFFMGRWIRRSSGYPTWFGRLCHASSVRVEREINEEYRCDRPVMRLSGHLLHYPFAKGVSYWMERHNRYSTAEAVEKIRGVKSGYGLIFSHDPGLRRKGLKQIYMRLPFRPLIGFLYLYFFRGGFLDGKAGLRFALLRTFYELLISIKYDEMVAERSEAENRK
ncbi:glycosyltransferase family 2 protein [Halomonas sp. EGI 63088]|uniref:Glycosyltransferase family 2 protein n=1 Tax=Halomonas flagellata TaxID=2920385 RepID=A0ABS9S054_9GAMM|nr:glycosyltransferase family 2 protein [Halomonas flagellata]MCH4565439.1 glycosyltransferase family 2 protein [Halomonas flagellata]